MKIIQLFILSILMMTGSLLNAQVVVSANGSTVDGSAMLEVKSAEKGFLPPPNDWSRKESHK